MKISPADLLDTFREMTLLELAAFVKDFEDEFGVTAAAPQQVTAPPADVAVVAEEITEFDVTLQAIGEHKVQVIKAVREITKMGLSDAKTFTESAPVKVLERVPRDVADAAAERLTAAGATVVTDAAADAS
jgi:large subunit ribosomal protein L7/L12